MTKKQLNDIEFDRQGVYKNNEKIFGIFLVFCLLFFITTPPCAIQFLAINLSTIDLGHTLSPDGHSRARVFINGSLLELNLQLPLRCLSGLSFDLDRLSCERYVGGPLAQAVKPHERCKFHALIAYFAHALIALRRRHCVGAHVLDVFLLSNQAQSDLCSRHIFHHRCRLWDSILMLEGLRRTGEIQYSLIEVILNDRAVMRVLVATGNHLLVRKELNGSGRIVPLCPIQIMNFAMVRVAGALEGDGQNVAVGSGAVDRVAIRVNDRVKRLITGCDTHAIFHKVCVYRSCAFALEVRAQARDGDNPSAQNPASRETVSFAE